MYNNTFQQNMPEVEFLHYLRNRKIRKKTSSNISKNLFTKSLLPFETIPFIIKLKSFIIIYGFVLSIIKNTKLQTHYEIQVFGKLLV